MRRGLSLSVVSALVASLALTVPASASQIAPGAPTSDELKRISTLMLTTSEVPTSLDLDRGWRFTSKGGYPMELPLCSVDGEAVTAPPVRSMHRVMLGESAQRGSRNALQQSIWVHPNEHAARKAWTAITSSAKTCDAALTDAGVAITSENGITLISREGSAIQSLHYEVSSGAAITPRMRRDLGDLSQELNSKWSAPAGTENFYVRSATGAELAQAFFSLLQNTGTPVDVLTVTKQQMQQAQEAVAPFLDPAFQLIRANGQRYLESNYIPADVDDFEVRDVVTTSPRDGVVVVRYSIRAPGETTPDTGLLLSDDWQPRMTTFHWDNAAKQWRLLSHANFSSPIAAICGQETTPLSAGTPSTSVADVALGESLVQQWRDITTGKIRMTVRHPAHQIQLADGQGWPSRDGTPIAWSPARAYDYENLVVTRNGDLLVVSYDAVAQDIVMEGDVYRSQASPRLLTYLRNPSGKWELISLANFTVPQQIPAGVDCVSSRS